MTMVAACTVFAGVTVAEAKPVRTVVPIKVDGNKLRTLTISTLVVQAQQSDEIWVIKDKYVLAYLQEMRKLGYRAVGGENLALGKDDTSKAELILGGTLTDVDCTNDRDVTCGVAIKWELMDVRTQAVVYSVVVRHEEMSLSQMDRTEVGNSLLMGGLRSLLARRLFVEALAPADGEDAMPAPVPKAEIPVGKVRRCPARKLGMPKASEEALKATALVKTKEGVGSAVVVSPDGLLLTAAHVVEEGEITVRFKDGEEYPADVLRIDSDQDVALLQVKDGQRETLCLPLRDEEAAIGESVYAMGAPGGEELSFSVTRGIISGRRKIKGVSYLQTDTSINPGNSGGPLVDDDGQVVGILSWKVVGEGLEGLGFAVPVDAALASLSLEFGESTGSLRVERSAGPSKKVSLRKEVVDEPDPPWFYVGEDAPGRRPTWVGVTRFFGWLSLGAGATTVAVTALLPQDPGNFGSLQVWNTVGWGVGIGGVAMILGSYIFEPNRDAPSEQTARAPSRPRVTASIGAPGIGPASLSLGVSF